MFDTDAEHMLDGANRLHQIVGDTSIGAEACHRRSAAQQDSVVHLFHVTAADPEDSEDLREHPDPIDVPHHDRVRFRRGVLRFTQLTTWPASYPAITSTTPSAIAC